MNPSKWHIKDWLLWKLGITNVQHTKVYTTYKCNAKCPTCQIWKLPRFELSRQQAKTIAENFKDIKKISITGGEAILWSHIIYFLNNIKAKSIVLNTNGLNPKKLKEVLLQIPKINIASILSTVIPLSRTGQFPIS